MSARVGICVYGLKFRVDGCEAAIGVGFNSGEAGFLITFVNVSLWLFHF